MTPPVCRSSCCGVAIDRMLYFSRHPEEDLDVNVDDVLAEDTEVSGCTITRGAELAVQRVCMCLWRLVYLTKLCDSCCGIIFKIDLNCFVFHIGLC